MVLLRERLRGKSWGLAHARQTADEIRENKAAVRALIAELFGGDVEARKRAADVARRITERGCGPLEKYADELAGLLESLPVEESRTRWHLGLVVPRVARMQAQRLRAARIMLTLAEDESNVVRCSAVEGLGALALVEPLLLGEAEAMVETFLRGETTLAMKSRARGVRKMLAKRYGSRWTRNDYNGHFGEAVMAKWPVAEAKAKFSEVIEQAAKKGPQQITKNGRPVAVLISMDEWKAEFGTKAPKSSLAEFFRNSPLRGSGIKIGRVRLDPRHVDF